MGIVKSVIGSVIGVAVALAVYYGIKQATGETYVWFPLVVGLVVGLAARVIAGSSVPSGSRVVVGAIAAILTGAAIYAPELIDGMAKTGEFGPIEAKNRLVNSSIAKNDSDDEDTDKSDDGNPQSGDSESTENKNSSNETTETSPPSDSDKPTGDGETKQGDDEDQEDGSAAKADVENSGDGEANTEVQKSDDSTDEPPRSIEDRSAMNDRSRGADPGASSTPPANMEQFAEFINKKKHESWLQTVLPILFTGIGMVMAYVLAQSGAQAPPKV